MTRDFFEALCRDLFLETMNLVERVLHDSGIDKSLIDEVVAVGGFTSFPKVEKLLSDFFPGKKLKFNVEEAVAYGAAMGATSNAKLETAKELFRPMDIETLNKFAVLFAYDDGDTLKTALDNVMKSKMTFRGEKRRFNF